MSRLGMGTECKSFVPRNKTEKGSTQFAARLDFGRTTSKVGWRGLSGSRKGPRDAIERSMTPAPEDNLRLTDFMDLGTLQEIQDSFAAVADVKAVITDADGNLLTQPTPAASFLRRQRALADTARAVAGLGPMAGAPPAVPAEEEDAEKRPQRDGAEYVAPIIVNEQRLGTIRMSANGTPGVDEAKLSSLAEKFGLEPRQVRSL